MMQISFDPKALMPSEAALLLGMVLAPIVRADHAAGADLAKEH